MKIFLVFRFKGVAECPDFIGAFSNREKAEEKCTSHKFAVCPATLDEDLTGHKTLWSEAYFPQDD